MNCTQCGHPEEDHHGRWSNGEVIPGRLCYYMENQGYQEDLCPCSGFNHPVPISSFTAACAKAGIKRGETVCEHGSSHPLECKLCQEPS